MRVLAVTNMYPTPARPTSGTFVEQQVEGLRRIGVTVEALHVDREREGVGAYLRMSGPLRAAVRRFDPELIHVMYGGFMAEIATRIVRDRPVVVSFCGSDLLGELLSGWKRKAVSGLGVRASHLAARRAAAIVVKSRNLREALPRRRDRERATILPNGVDQERFRPLDRTECRRRLSWPAAGFQVLFPANQGNALKRPWLAAAAMEALRARGVEGELRRLQGVPHSEAPCWLNACNCLLLTSLHEGSPNIVKEALACDLPVVSVDVGDVAERLEGVAGAYLAEATPDALADALAKVHAGPGRVDGRAAVADLTLERVAERLLQVYRAAAGNS